jgi:ppGpp synthetase/RelA/SpoT-type nucleotidyltranferase
VDHLSVTSRTKSLESFVEKIERKGYSNPGKEMTDLCGIRIITFIEADVARVGDVIRKAFKVHEHLSLDKSTELESDRLGYRSVHFICDLV